MNKPKPQTTKTVVSSPYGGRDGCQPDEIENEQKQQQPANHSSDNAEIARCLTHSLTLENDIPRRKFHPVENDPYSATFRTKLITN